MIRRTRDTGLSGRSPASAPAIGDRPARPQRPQRPNGNRTATAQQERVDRSTAPSGSTEPAPTAARPGRDTADLGPSDKPGDILTLLRELSNLVKTENDALKARRFQVVKDGVARKQTLTRAYLQLAVTLRRQPDVAEAMPPGQREALKREAERLEPLMAENGRLLKTNIEVINLVIGKVVEAVKDMRAEGSVTYGDDGDMDGRYGDHRQCAVALNREL